MELTKLYKALSEVNIDAVYNIQNYRYNPSFCAQFITQFFYDIDSQFGDYVATILYDNVGRLRKDLFLSKNEDGFDYFKLSAELFNDDDKLLLPSLDCFDNIMIDTMLLTQMIIANYDNDYIIRLRDNNPTALVLPFSMALLLQKKFEEKTMNHQDIYLYNADLLSFVGELGVDCYDYEYKMALIKKSVDAHRVNGKLDARYFYKNIAPHINDCIIEQGECNEDTQLILGYLLSFYNNSDYNKNVTTIRNSIKNGFIDIIEHSMEVLADSVDLPKLVQKISSEMNEEIFVFNKNALIEHTEDPNMQEYLKSLDNEELKKFLSACSEDDDEMKDENENGV